MTLTNTQDNTSRTIKHFWYTGWPDHGVPASAAPVIRFLRAVKKDTLTTKVRPSTMTPSAQQTNRLATNSPADSLPP